MTTVTAPSRTGGRIRRPTEVVAGRPLVPLRPLVMPSPGRQPIDLELLSAHWQRALDAAGRALQAAGHSLVAQELHERRAALVRESERTNVALHAIARSGGQPAPWLSPTPVTSTMLGLPATVRACLFDVEGVLTDSSRLHAWAWGEVFDDFLSRLGETTGWHLVPFDRLADYRAHVEGRSRIEGVNAFLHSRGIQVRQGQPDEPSDADSAHGLARRKGELLERRLHERAVTALPVARRYLEAARRAGVMRAAVCESASTLPMLEQAGLGSLIDAHVDGAVVSGEGLRSRPAPDILVAACRLIDVPPESTATFTATAAGVVAGRRAGMLTVGVGDARLRESLEKLGADRVVPSLGALLDRRLTTALDSSR